jgi:hypothetical protein
MESGKFIIIPDMEPGGNMIVDAESFQHLTTVVSVKFR